MLSRNVQLFSRKQTISVVTCIPCELETYRKTTPSCCDLPKVRNCTTKTLLCASKTTPPIAAVKVPFAFPRVSTLFTRSPGCSLDPITFGLSNRIPYHMQTRSLTTELCTRNNLHPGKPDNVFCSFVFCSFCKNNIHTDRLGLLNQRFYTTLPCDSSVFHRQHHHTLSGRQCRYISTKTPEDSETDNVVNRYIFEDTSEDSVTLDDETKSWLDEVRNDFRFESGEDERGGDKPIDSSSNSDEVSTDSSETSSSETSESNSSSDSSSSDSELEDHVIQEVLDHAEFYAEDGHELRKKPSKTLTNIDEEASHYSTVSEYAQRITTSNDGSAEITEDLSIAIEEFSDYESDWEEEKPHYIPPIPLTRGMEGVFDLDDLMTLLKEENAKDICVISVAKDFRYVDYLVISTSISPRHSVALTDAIKWIHKRKKASSDPTIHIEKGHHWTAMDLGNIALHIMAEDVRQSYDLETLWACGALFDEKSREADQDPYALEMNALPDDNQKESVSKKNFE